MDVVKNHSPESQHESGSLSSTAALPTSSARLISYVAIFYLKCGHVHTKTHPRGERGILLKKTKPDHTIFVLPDLSIRYSCTCMVAHESQIHLSHLFEFSSAEICEIVSSVFIGQICWTIPGVQ